MATDFYIKFDEVVGEATDANHEEWSEILSWRHQFLQPGTSRGGHGPNPEKITHLPLTFHKRLDTATIDILKYCWSGKDFETVTIECFRAAGEESNKYLTIELKDVIVSDYSIEVSEGDLPIESISLTYSKVTYIYTEKDKENSEDKGQMPVSTDLKNNITE
jgi:type VI secretion system secreted protein Hcp